MEKHRGIRIDKIPVEGVVGLIFGIGTLLIFLTGVPETRWFLLISVPIGVIVGTILYIWHKQSG